MRAGDADDASDDAVLPLLQWQGYNVCMGPPIKIINFSALLSGESYFYSDMTIIRASIKKVSRNKHSFNTTPTS